MLKESESTIFAPSSLWLIAVLAIILACGLGVRLYDLKDPPLDYAASRQLRSARIARGKYYRIAQDVPEWKREVALRQGKHAIIEPTVMETIVAGTYWLVGGEHVWIARIYSSLFWVIGGVAVYALAKEMTSVDGGVIGLTYYLFSPFGMVSSRSFQPDPLMTVSIVFAWWTFYRWHKTHTWKWAIFAGLTAGFAMFVKATAVFFLLGGFGALILLSMGIQKSLRDKQVWCIGLLAGLPVLLYHMYGLFVVGTLAKQFSGRFFPHHLINPEFYGQLIDTISTVIGHELILIITLLGIFFLKDKISRGFLLGIGGGYIIYILIFSYHAITHSYYHLPVIPFSAILIASFSSYILNSWSGKVVTNLFRLGLVLTVLLGVGGGYFWFHSQDFRHEPGWYWDVANKVSRDKSIAVLSQNYGNRIAYYGWIKPKVWLEVKDQRHAEQQGADSDPFQEAFQDFISGVDYFIITNLQELRRQEKLHDKLYNTYSIHAEGGGFVIFDLNQPIYDE
ncbi:MAG: glycosyltransferase family 39 protein [Anaerolineales bacterium]